MDVSKHSQMHGHGDKRPFNASLVLQHKLPCARLARPPPLKPQATAIPKTKPAGSEMYMCTVKAPHTQLGCVTNRCCRQYHSPLGR